MTRYVHDICPSETIINHNPCPFDDWTLVCGQNDRAMPFSPHSPNQFQYQCHLVIGFWFLWFLFFALFLYDGSPFHIPFLFFSFSLVYDVAKVSISRFLLSSMLHWWRMKSNNIITSESTWKFFRIMGFFIFFFTLCYDHMRGFRRLDSCLVFRWHGIRIVHTDRSALFSRSPVSRFLVLGADHFHFVSWDFSLGFCWKFF